MIFYFSGTGNSKYIASCLAERFGDSLIEITDKLNSTHDTYTLKDDERVGIVFGFWVAFSLLQSDLSDNI